MTSFARVKALIGSIDGWLSPTESRFLFEAARKTKVAIVEIGSWKGKSTIALAAGVSGKKSVFAVDPHEGIIDKNRGKKEQATYKEFLLNINRASVESFVVPIKKTSENAAKNWEKPIGLLFIDGLHDYFHTREDIMLWTPHVTDGGIIAFHDAYASTHEVYKAVKEWLNRVEINHIGVAGSIVYVVKGVPKTIFAAFFLHLRMACISFGQRVYKALYIPQAIRFFITHRIIKFLLLDRIRISMIYP